MNKFELVTVNATNFDGRIVPAGTTIGALETAEPIDNLISGLRCLQLALVPASAYVAPEPPKAPKAKVKPTPPAPSENQQSQESEPENLDSIQTGPGEIETALADVDPLAGLTPKVADSLREALIDGEPCKYGSLDTPAKVEAAIAEGFDLAELDGIGPKMVVKIKDWLAALKS